MRDRRPVYRILSWSDPSRSGAAPMSNGDPCEKHGVPRSMRTEVGRRRVLWGLGLGLLGATLLLTTQDSSIPGSADSQVTEVGPRSAVPEVPEESGDLDGDHLDDALEDDLAERFAPIVFHGERETTFPTSVDWWLERAHLSVVGDGSGAMRQMQSGPLRQAHLIGQTVSMSGTTISSSGSRSRGKKMSFVLENLQRDNGHGPRHPTDWVTSRT